jgi:lipopolysaccharide export system permease protein
VEQSKPKNQAKEDPLFVQEGSSVIEAGAVGQDGAALSHVRIYERNDVGNIVKQVFANDARFDPIQDVWHLTGVWTTAILPGQASRTKYVDKADWNTKLTPAEFSDLVERPQAMTFSKIRGFTSATQVGVRPTYFYETWLQKRLALPVSSILMILLAAPVAHSLHRRERGLAAGMAVGFGLGFLYFLTDGLVLSLGESGAVAPFLAAWLPILLFAAIGGAWLIKQEGY